MHELNSLCVVPIGQTAAYIWPFFYLRYLEFWGLTLTYNFPSRRAMIMTHARAKIKVKDQSVQRIEWKQTDGQTDTT